MRSIHCPLRSVNAARFLASAITLVSNRPIWLVDAACPVTAQPGNDIRSRRCGCLTRELVTGFWLWQVKDMAEAVA